MKPSGAPGSRRDSLENKGVLDVGGDGSRMPGGDSPGRPGLFSERVRAGVEAALVALREGRVAEASEMLEGVLAELGLRETR